MIQHLLRLPSILILLCSLAATPALAQFRTLPQDAKFGVIGMAQALPLVQVDGKLMKLAPGGVIYDGNNRSILHGQLPSGVSVAYNFDLNGDIARIYILTASELALIKNKQ